MAKGSRNNACGKRTNFCSNKLFYTGQKNGGSSPIGCWILATGFWNDSCTWMDSETWID